VRASSWREGLYFHRHEDVVQHGGHARALWYAAGSILFNRAHFSFSSKEKVLDQAANSTNASAMSASLGLWRYSPSLRAFFVGTLDREFKLSFGTCPLLCCRDEWLGECPESGLWLKHVFCCCSSRHGYWGQALIWTRTRIGSA
jgi:hypothetical protein